jgi:hypothetical protein
LDSQFVTKLGLPLSQIRLEAYRPASGSDSEMVANYFWNVQLAESLVPALHAVELALRNSIHTALTDRFQNEMWFYQLDVLQPGQLVQFAQALSKVAKKPHPHAGRVVAELTFGFWVTLLSAPYDQTLWRTENFSLLNTIFPHAVGYSRKQIADRFNHIRLLRNRVFHYEAIWNRPNLQADHADIQLAIGWISPTLLDSILAIDRFRNAFDAREQVATRIRAVWEPPRSD